MEEDSQVQQCTGCHPLDIFKHALLIYEIQFGPKDLVYTEPVRSPVHLPNSNGKHSSLQNPSRF